MAIKLSILTVTYNNGKQISSFLESLEKKMANNFTELIIVDSGSKDETADLIEKFSHKSKLPIKLVKSENEGFGAGNNKASKKAEGEVLLILNPDTRLLDSDISPAIDYLLSDEKRGLLGLKLITPDGSVQKSVRNLPSVTNAFNEFFLNKKNSFGEYNPSSDTPVEVGCVYGAAMLIRKSDFEKVGGFEEKYFLYFEDLDLCRKIKNQLKKSVIYFPDFRIQHEIGKSGDSESSKSNLLTYIFPSKKTGRIYHQVKSSTIYHGFISHLLITLIIFFGQKLKRT